MSTDRRRWRRRSCRPTATSTRRRSRRRSPAARACAARGSASTPRSRRSPSTGGAAPPSTPPPATRSSARCVVNAAGMWGMEVGRMVGVRVPAVAVEHQYLLSGPIDGYTPVELGRMPTMRDPDHLVYYKPDGPGPAGRRLRARHDRRSASTRHPVAVPAPAVRPELRPLRAARRARHQAHAGARAGRHPHADQRPDPLLGRRRLRDGPGARARQLLRRHRLPVRHRRRRRGGQDDGRVDPRGPAVARPVAARRAPLLVPPHDAPLHGAAHGRAVRPPLQARRAGLRAGHARAASGAARCTTRSRARARCSARVADGSARTGSRPPASSRSTSRRSAGRNWFDARRREALARSATAWR